MTKLLRLFVGLWATAQVGYGQSAPPSCFNDVGEMVQQNGKPTATNALRYGFTPVVVAQNSTQNVLIEVVTTGTPSAVNLFLDATQATQPLNDSGTNGDKKANDGIYSAIVAPPKGSWTDPFVGYTRVLESGKQVVQINTFINLLTKDMPVLQPKKLDNATQYTDYIFNVVVASTLDTPPDNQKLAINQAFYQYHPDNFDFINYVLVPGFVGNRFHSNITNTVQGIGLTQFNNTAQFGSRGRLLGYNVFPVPSLFDGASNGYIHEIGHQWINYLSTTFLKDGVPHWPLSNLAAGVMGISTPGSSAGGQFPYSFTEVAAGYRLDRDPGTDGPAFNQWELYLMGLLPASEVKTPAIIFKNQTAATSPASGIVYPKTDFNTYQISDLITAVGNRTPLPTQSQKKFNSATILLSERLLTAEEISYFDFMAKRAEGLAPVAVREGLTSYMGKPFWVATGNRATMQAVLNTNCFTLPAAPTITATGSLTICPGSSLTLTAPAGNSSYTWYQNGSPLPDRTASITATQGGNYSAQVRNASGCTSPVSAELTVVAGSNPPKPTIALSTTGLTSSSPTGNQWLLNGNPVPNATGPTIKIGAGTYSVRVTVGGCSSESDPFVVTATEDPAATTPFELSHTPNPVAQSAQIGFSLPKSSAITLRLLNLSGQTVRVMAEGTYAAGQHTISAAVDGLPAGFYVYRIETDYGSLARKMLISQ